VLPGLSVCVAPVSEPGFHVYEVAPVAVITVELPLQIVAFAAVTVGLVFTVTVRVMLVVHVPFDPIIV
jgi:hypothetical protein